MRPTYDSDTATFRQTVRDFLRANLPPGWKGIGALGADEAHHFANDVWRPVLAEHGYLAPAWPAEFGGGGLSELEQVILVEEFSKVGAATRRLERSVQYHLLRKHHLELGHRRPEGRVPPEDHLGRVRVLSGLFRAERGL